LLETVETVNLFEKIWVNRERSPEILAGYGISRGHF